jgi:AcrR family transcriptional regulator
MTNPTPPPTRTDSTRVRLLDAAARLFYQQGVSVGVEALCRAAGVSKRSMYQLFDSKDALVAASLERSAPAFQAALLPPDDDGRAPRARILHVFERFEELSAEPGFHGCPFVATAVELKSPEHPGSLVARRHKDEMTAFFQQEAEHAGAPNPTLLARQLTVVFDGASARAVVQAHELDGLAVTTASALLNHAGIA